MILVILRLMVIVKTALLKIVNLLVIVMFNNINGNNNRKRWINFEIIRI